MGPSDQERSAVSDQVVDVLECVVVAVGIEALYGPGDDPKVVHDRGKVAERHRRVGLFSPSDVEASVDELAECERLVEPPVGVR